MAAVTIRNLDPGDIVRLKERAKRNHRSMEAEVRALISESLGPEDPFEVEGVRFDRAKARRILAGARERRRSVAPRPRQAIFRVEGEPVSETIIRERR